MGGQAPLDGFFGQRWKAEAVNLVIKRKFGESIRARKPSLPRREPLVKGLVLQSPSVSCVLVPGFPARDKFGRRMSWLVVRIEAVVVSNLCNKASGQTNHMERWYCTLRRSCARFVRKTLSFSKSDAMHAIVTRLFIIRYNLSLVT